MVKNCVLIIALIVSAAVLSVGLPVFALDSFKEYNIADPQADYLGDATYGRAAIDMDYVSYWSTGNNLYIQISTVKAPRDGWVSGYCDPDCSSIDIRFYNRVGKLIYSAYLDYSTRRFISIMDEATGGWTELPYGRGDWEGRYSSYVSVMIDVSALPKLGDAFYFAVETHRSGKDGVYYFYASDRIPNTGMLPVPPLDFSLSSKLSRQTVNAGNDTKFQIWVDSPLASLLSRKVSLEIVGLDSLPFRIENATGTPPFSATLVVRPPINSGGNYTFRIRGIMPDPFYSLNKTITLQVSVVPKELIQQKLNITTITKTQPPQTITTTITSVSSTTITSTTTQFTTTTALSTKVSTITSTATATTTVVNTATTTSISTITLTSARPPVTTTVTSQLTQTVGLPTEITYGAVGIALVAIIAAAILAMRRRT